jgi:hypothetical protein
MLLPRVLFALMEPRAIFEHGLKLTAGEQRWLPAAPTNATIKRRQGVSPIEGAALGTCALAALQSVRNSAGINIDLPHRAPTQEEPKTLLIRNASGGVGTLVVQVIIHPFPNPPTLSNQITPPQITLQQPLPDPYQRALPDPYQRALSEPYQTLTREPYQSRSRALSDPYLRNHTHHTHHTHHTLHTHHAHHAHHTRHTLLMF